LIKFAPFRTSWTDIIRAGTFTLRGVRNLQASRNLSLMATGDCALFYQSQQEQAVMGLLEVTRSAYPDPTSADPRWVTCDFRPVESFLRPVSLARIKADPHLASIALVRQPRLAVMPLESEQFEEILTHGR
jgi:predicted RNA-binding protein with PUA-like domain